MNNHTTNPRSDYLYILAAILGVLFVAGSIFAVTYRKTIHATITSVKWERVIDVEDYQPRSLSGWDETVPNDGYDVSCHRQYRRTERYLCGSHQDCTTRTVNGRTERSCTTVMDYCNRSVYDDWCNYTADRWALKRQVRASGTKEPEPYWPEPDLMQLTAPYGSEREGTRHERYTLFIGTLKCEVKQAIWDEYNTDDRVVFKAYITGDPECKTLRHQ